jgi:hypothetical protein
MGLDRIGRNSRLDVRPRTTGRRAIADDDHSLHLIVDGAMQSPSFITLTAGPNRRKRATAGSAASPTSRCATPTISGLVTLQVRLASASCQMAPGEGRLPRLLTTLERVRLLIIDDWGPEPLKAEQRRDLLDRRSNSASHRRARVPHAV